MIFLPYIAALLNSDCLEGVASCRITAAVVLSYSFREEKIEVGQGNCTANWPGTRGTEHFGTAFVLGRITPCQIIDDFPITSYPQGVYRLPIAYS